MKKIVVGYISIILLSLSIVPAINLKNAHPKTRAELCKLNWYNFDFAMPTVARFLYSMGITPYSHDVIIGKNEWLFLADRYGNALSLKRVGPSFETIEAVNKINEATKSWENYFKQKGVSLFKIMLIPSKDVIYPEYLPDWVQPKPITARDLLLQTIDENSPHMNMKKCLMEAKNQFKEPLFYQTDMHWNTLGAWVAYSALTHELSKIEKEFQGLTSNEVHVHGLAQRQGGDLSRFLKISATLSDHEVMTQINSKRAIETEIYNYETGEQEYVEPDLRNRLDYPLLVKSRYALNQKKVLWIRDSFGIALSPFMAATFGQTLIVYIQILSPDQLIHLVKTYKPDYVIITAYEHVADLNLFGNIPVMQEPLNARD